MANRTTQTTLVGLDRAEYLGESIRTHKTMTSAKLSEDFSGLPPKAEGEPPWPDWTNVQEANLFKLDLAIDEAHLTSEAHKDAKLQVNQATNRRNNVVNSFETRHRSLRGSFEAAYTREALALVGLEDPFLRAYLAAREQCRTVANRLRVPGLREKLGEPQADQAHLELGQIAVGVEGHLARFERAIQELVGARKLRDEALVAKRTAEQRLNSTIANVARVQEGYYRMAGFEELADRMRLTIPKSSKARKAADDQPPDDPSSDDQPTDDQATDDQLAEDPSTTGEVDDLKP